MRAPLGRGLHGVAGDGMDAQSAEDAEHADTIARFRRWAAVALGVAVIGYGGYAVFRGFRETAGQLVGFHWVLYIAVIGLTCVNYGLRYMKWAWLLDRLEVDIPHASNAWVFIAGLAMAISPGKAGELLKPYLIRTLTGTPMERTVPALIAERGSDGIAVLMLAAFGVSTYYADGVRVIVITAIVSAVCLAVIASERLSLGAIGLVGRAGFAGIAARIETAYRSLRVCLTPGSIVVLMAISLAAWLAECVGYWLIFRGLHVEADFGAATFLYAFATVFGGASPGGLGMADGALVEGALRVIPGIDGGQALAAALLVRIATLWFGVLLGAFALFRMEGVIRKYRTRPATV